MEVNEEEMSDTDMDVASELIERSPIKSLVSSHEKKDLIIKVEETKDDSNETEIPEVASELLSSSEYGDQAEVADEADV